MPHILKYRRVSPSVSVKAPEGNEQPPPSCCCPLSQHHWSRWVALMCVLRSFVCVFFIIYHFTDYFNFLAIVVNVHRMRLEDGWGVVCCERSFAEDRKHVRLSARAVAHQHQLYPFKGLFLLLPFSDKEAAPPFPFRALVVQRSCCGSIEDFRHAYVLFCRAFHAPDSPNRGSGCFGVANVGELRGWCTYRSVWGVGDACYCSRLQNMCRHTYTAVRKLEDGPSH